MTTSKYSTIHRDIKRLQIIGQETKSQIVLLARPHPHLQSSQRLWRCASADRRTKQPCPYHSAPILPCWTGHTTLVRDPPGTSNPLRAESAWSEVLALCGEVHSLWVVAGGESNSIDTLFYSQINSFNNFLDILTVIYTC